MIIPFSIKIIWLSAAFTVAIIQNTHSEDVSPQTILPQILGEEDNEHIIERKYLNCIIDFAENSLDMDRNPSIFYVSSCEEIPDSPIFNQGDYLAHQFPEYSRVGISENSLFEFGTDNYQETLTHIPYIIERPTNKDGNNQVAEEIVDMALVLNRNMQICIVDLRQEIARSIEDFPALIYLDYSRCSVD